MRAGNRHQVEIERPPRVRRRILISVRIIGMLALVCVAVGLWIAVSTWRQRTAIRELEGLGVVVHTSPRGPRSLPGWIKDLRLNVFNKADWVSAGLKTWRTEDGTVVAELSPSKRKANPRLNDDALVHLKALTSVGDLELARTRVSDAGLSHVAGMTNLECLDLDSTQVTDAGLWHLQRLKKLEVLDLQNTQVSDAGLVHLQGLPNLYEIKVGGTEVTPAGIADLKRSMNILCVFQEAFALIDKSTDVMGWDQPNPAAVVRAVNHLRALGKDQAIAVLRGYVRRSPAEATSSEVHAPDQQRLCTIIPLLFEPNDVSVGTPFSIGSRQVSALRLHVYISVEADLPFHNVDIGARSGPTLPNRRHLVDWAATQGRLREKPIRPGDDPIHAADALLQSILPDEGDGHDSMRHSHVRQQALRCVAGLFPAEDRRKFSGYLPDEEWLRLKRVAAELKIRWDENRQEYVSDR